MRIHGDSASYSGAEVTPVNIVVYAANGTPLMVDGEAVVEMKLNGQRIFTKTLVTPDVEEIMMGSDWLEAHECLWDFKTGHIIVNNQPADHLSVHELCTSLLPGIGVFILTITESTARLPKRLTDGLTVH